MATANTTTAGKSAQKPTKFDNHCVPDAILHYCFHFPDSLQPSVQASYATKDGRYIVLANIDGPLAYMTSRWNFVERIGGALIDGGLQ